MAADTTEPVETLELELTDEEYQHLLDDTSYYGPGTNSRLFAPVPIKFVNRFYCSSRDKLSHLNHKWKILNVNFIVDGFTHSHKIYRFAYDRIADGSRVMHGCDPSRFEPEKLDEFFGKDPFYERFIRNQVHKSARKA